MSRKALTGLVCFLAVAALLVLIIVAAPWLLFYAPSTVTKHWVPLGVVILCLAAIIHLWPRRGDRRRWFGE